MSVITLTEDQRTTLTNGLRVAAERFKGHATDLRTGDYHSVGGFPLPMDGNQRRVEIDRLSAQFECQRAESITLAELLEEAQTIEVRV